MNRYNTNHTISFTGGKEFVISRNNKKTILGLNTKVLYSGGLRDTPINIEESINSNQQVYYTNQAFSIQNPYYFRIDAGVSLKFNKPKLTSILQLAIQNASNRKNVFGIYYDNLKEGVQTIYQTSLIPVLSYKIEF